MAIAITYLEWTVNGSRNTMSLFDRHGEEVLRYAKVHLCTFHSEDSLEPGTEFPVVELDTAAGPVRVGTLICYGREFRKRRGFSCCTGLSWCWCRTLAVSTTTGWRS